MTTGIHTADGLGQHQSSFRSGLLDIEKKYLDYFMENGRLVDNCVSFYVMATDTCYFKFTDNSSLPDYIRMECTKLYQEVFA